MGLINIFKKNKKENSNHEIVNYDSGVIIFNKYDFIGNTVKSNNGRFIVGIRDHYFENNKPIKGEILLLESNELLYRKTFARPNNAMVSDVGIVVFCDWLEPDELNGDFNVLNINGDIIFKKHVKANLGNCAISQDSTIAIFETYSSDSEDSNKIFVIDITKKEVISSFNREFRFNEIKINSNESQILFIDDVDKFIYDFNGNLKNVEEIEKKLFNGLKINEQLLYLNKLCSENCQKFIESSKYLIYTNILNENSNEFEGWQKRDLAKIYKNIGEYFEVNSDFQNAVNYFEEALRLDKKVGVKRKLDKLKK